MKNQFSYFPVRTVQTSACLQFDAFEAFSRFLKTHQISDVFLLMDDNNEAVYFGILHNQILFRQPTTGFKTIEDFSKAIDNLFPNANCFYEALQMGYHTYDDYRLVKEAGISCQETFQKMKAAHYISGFSDYQSLLQQDIELPVLPLFSNPFELYSYATERGFADYTQFKKAIVKGFTEAVVYGKASEKGFPSFADYEEASQKGFTSFSDLQLARENVLRDYDDMIRFKDLSMVHCDTCCHDQKLLLTLLSKVEEGKKISINKLKDIFSGAKEEYRYTDTNEMPGWFTHALQSDADMIGFLHRNGQAKKFGYYDIDGEYFQVSRIKDRSIVIDGSNIAHNSISGNGSKPLVSNIIKMIEHLKKEGFSDITVIADASLKHKVHDLNKLPHLKQITNYQEAPRETTADVFLIQYVKKNQCLLVSNDTFKEWKVQDKWTAENIDFYRLAFMITGGQVLMPDLK